MLDLFFLRKYKFPEDVIDYMANLIDEKDKSEIASHVLNRPTVENLKLM